VLFDDAGHTAGSAHIPVCWCCGEDVDFAQDYQPVLPFCSHRVSERCRKWESGSCKEASAGPDIQSNRSPPRAADEMRLGLRCPVHRAQYAGALHHMREAAGSSKHVAQRAKRLAQSVETRRAGTRKGSRIARTYTRRRPPAIGPGAPARGKFRKCWELGRQPPTIWTDEGGARRLRADTRRSRECCAAGAAKCDSR
jgi:hypothetical protein